MAINGRLRGIAASTDTKALVKSTLEAAAAKDRSALKKVFKGAAGTDGNRHLSLAEAMMVRDAFDAALDTGDFSVGSVKATVADQIAAAVAKKDPDGIKTYFTSTNKKVNDVLIDGMKDAVARANGKPVEIHAMVFSFTDKKVADAMLDLAEQHPNLTIRLITDFAQLPTSGHRQPSRLAIEAKKRGLPNLQVKFKRDGAYTWNEALERPVYHHGSTKGLNHHKGFVTLIDGKPDQLFTGSFNWSTSATKKNYENLFVVSGSNPSNRRIIADYQAEFGAFFNHEDALNRNQARAHKRTIFNEMRVANGLEPQGAEINAVADAPYVPITPSASFDVNHMTDKNYDKLKAALGDSMIARSVAYNYATYGAFTDFDNLAERVSKVRKLPAAKQDKLRSLLDFGEGRVLINAASVSELMRSLKLSKTQATKIVAKRKLVGDFESADEIKNIPGISRSVFGRISPRLNDDVGRAYFSARGYDDAKASTGWAQANKDKLVPVMGPDGEVEIKAATLSAGVIDLINRAEEGDTIKLAMYGLSANTPEYAELVDAAARGVNVKVVLNEAYNGGVAAALSALGASGLPIEVRVQTKKTMHMKFGIVNDDVFQGSANFSTSSSSKHTEDRFVVKNNKQLAGEFEAEFDLVWDKSTPQD